MKNETYRRWEKWPPSSFQQRAQKLRSGDFFSFWIFSKNKHKNIIRKYSYSDWAINYTGWDSITRRLPGFNFDTEGKM